MTRKSLVERIKEDSKVAVYPKQEDGPFSRMKWDIKCLIERGLKRSFYKVEVGWNPEEQIFWVTWKKTIALPKESGRKFIRCEAEYIFSPKDEIIPQVETIIDQINRLDAWSTANEIMNEKE